MSIIFIATLSVLITAGIAALLVRSLALRARDPIPDAEWLREFSTARYRPMLRLLDEEDYRFLLAASGDKAAVRRLRAERRRVFRAYLRNLVRDFNRLHRAARIVVLESETAHPAIHMKLFRLHAGFIAAVMAVRVRLVLHTLGRGPVDVRPLVEALETMRSSFGSLEPAHQASV